MKPLDSFELDAADVRRIDEIITLEAGHGLAAETAHWRWRRRIVGLALMFGLLVLAVGGVFLYRTWA